MVRFRETIVSCLWALFATYITALDGSLQEVERHLEMGKQFLAKGQFSDALTHYHAAVDLDSENYQTLYRRATCYLAMGKSKSALPDLDQVILLKPDFASARIQRANVQFKHGELDAAQLDYEAVLSKDPENKEALDKLSLIEPTKESIKIANDLYSVGDISQAERYLTVAVEVCPWDSKLREMRANCYEAMGDVQKAIADIRSATKLIPDSTDSFFRISSLYYQIGDTDESLVQIRECLKLNPEHKKCFPLYKKLKKLVKQQETVRTSIQNKDWQACIENVEQVSKTESTVHAIVLQTKEFLCKCLSQGGSVTDALKTCNEVLSIEPDNPDVLCDRAEAYLLNEQYEEAVKDYQKAIGISEEFRRAKEGLDRAQKLLKQSQKKDYYKILGVKRNANKKQINKAYRKLAQQWHPDNFKPEDKDMAQKKFIDIAAAKEVLTDPEKRQRFDNGEDPLDPESQQQHGHPFYGGFNPFGGQGEKYILAVDVGTTFVKCHVYDRNGVVAGKSQLRVELQYPSVGAVETDPEVLWKQFVQVVKDALKNSNTTASNIHALGICTQRATFITWDRETGEPFHSFITWQDTRASDVCDNWNNSWSLRALHAGSKLAYVFTRNRRYLSGSIFKLRSIMALPRLLWAIENIPRLKERVKVKQVLFGCIDTWLLWKLTDGKMFSTEISLASSTGMYDPYLNFWGESILSLLNIPMHILPEIEDTGHIFGYCSENIFGATIPIASMAGDQQAGTFGCCCFEQGSVKLTMGTGVFVDMNTADKPHTSMHGIYPLVGWKLKSELVYLAESSSNDAGSAIIWAQSIGLIDNVEETSTVANSIPDTGGVYFVPAFRGLQVPINDDQACAMFVGLKADTAKPQLIRAILESVAFRVCQIYNVMLSEARFSSTYIRCVGGVSNNDFICQTIADLSNTELSRMENTEITSLGVAFIAGLATDFWQNKDQLRSIAKHGKTFTPRNEQHRRATFEQFEQWQRAVQRSLNWYNNEEAK